jgi:hypothetical protein
MDELLTGRRPWTTGAKELGRTFLEVKVIHLGGDETGPLSAHSDGKRRDDVMRQRNVTVLTANPKGRFD